MTITYIDLKPFVAQFLYRSFGNPVKFPRRSVENATLCRFTQTLPRGRQPETESTYRVRLEGNEVVRIVVPENPLKPADRFFYLGERGKRALEETCENLFTRCLWQELYDMTDLGCSMMTAIYAWMELHGISIEYAYTVRQRYYRLRKAYQQHNINIMFRRRNHDDVAIRFIKNKLMSS